jgi:hypothetical protein
MAIIGGAVTTLVPGQAFAYLALDGQVLYYSSGDSIPTVPVGGGTPSTIITELTPVTALYPPTTADGLLGVRPTDRSTAMAAARGTGAIQAVWRSTLRKGRGTLIIPIRRSRTPDTICGQGLAYAKGCVICLMT